MAGRKERTKNDLRTPIKKMSKVSAITTKKGELKKKGVFPKRVHYMKESKTARDEKQRTKKRNTTGGKRGPGGHPMERLFFPEKAKSRIIRSFSDRGRTLRGVTKGPQKKKNKKLKG